jgi:hypothetical protein
VCVRRVAESRLARLRYRPTAMKEMHAVLYIYVSLSLSRSFYIAATSTACSGKPPLASRRNGPVGMAVICVLYI